MCLNAMIHFYIEIQVNVHQIKSPSSSLFNIPSQLLMLQKPLSLLPILILMRFCCQKFYHSMISKKYTPERYSISPREFPRPSCNIYYAVLFQVTCTVNLLINLQVHVQLPCTTQTFFEFLIFNTSPHLNEFCQLNL